MNNIKRLSGIIFSCILAALLIPLLIGYSYAVDNMLSTYIKQTMGEISEQSIQSIHREINHQYIMLNETAGHITDAYKNNPEIVEDIIDRIYKTYDFKRVGIINSSGGIVSSDGVRSDLSERPYIQRAFNGETVISDVLFDMDDGRRVFVYAGPVYDYSDPDKVEGVFFTTCDSEKFRDHLSVSAFDGKGYSYIVKSDGTTVTDSPHESSFVNMTNVFKSMSESGDNEEAVNIMRQDMSERKTGLVVFSNKITKYMYYAPLGVNDWYILNVVPTDVMDGTRNTIMLVTYVICGAIILVGVIFIRIMLGREKARREEIAHVLYYDELTGGMTFAKFCVEAKRLIKEDCKNAACVMADLDNFRLINNLYGHDDGDKTIIHTYVILKKIIKGKDLLARRVADRFFMLIYFESIDELNERLSSFCSDLENSWSDSENEFILKPSIGVYIIENPDEDIEAAANNATIAHDIIVQKSEHIAYFDMEFRDKLKMNKTLEDRMEYAHKNHEFIPYFQPKYDAATGEICGAEALIRWRNSDGNITMPGEFIPLAETNGFIRVLDRDMFEAVCRFQKEVIEGGMTPVPISVNVSRQLMYESSFAQDYINTIRKYELSPELVELEITESVLFDDFECFRSIIDTLRNNGFKILMDDFGTGYSSLMMLRFVPIDNLKLDKSFIDSYEEEKGQKIITCVVDLAKSLSLPLTAEGVETQGQFDFLKDMGCNVIQGFYFSKPVTKEKFVAMLSSSAKV